MKKLLLLFLMIFTLLHAEEELPIPVNPEDVVNKDAEIEGEGPRSSEQTIDIDERVKDILDMADGSMEDGKFERAISLYTKAIKLKDDSYTHVYRGMAYEYANQKNRALEDYKIAYKIDNKNKTALYNMAVLYNTLGKPKMAVDALDKALAIDKNFKRAKRLKQKIEG